MQCPERILSPSGGGLRWGPCPLPQQFSRIARQLAPGSRHLGRVQCFGLGKHEQQAFVTEQMIENRGKQRRLARALAQILERQAGQGEETHQPLRLSRQKSQRRQSQRQKATPKYAIHGLMIPRKESQVGRASLALLPTTLSVLASSYPQNQRARIE